MALLKVAPTKSNLLSLKRQLAFAQEGYDLLEQKRQILIFELMSRLDRARAAERDLAQALAQAYGTLRDATLDMGSEAIDRSAVGVAPCYRLEMAQQHLMGMKIPHLTLRPEPFGPQFGVGGTSASCDLAMRRFVDLLPRLVELAELQSAILRLARELRKTQRRCNALSKIFIPDFRETIAYIISSLEERERESFVILKMIRERHAQSGELATESSAE